MDLSALLTISHKQLYVTDTKKMGEILRTNVLSKKMKNKNIKLFEKAVRVSGVKILILHKCPAFQNFPERSGLRNRTCVSFKSDVNVFNLPRC